MLSKRIFIFEYLKLSLLAFCLLCLPIVSFSQTQFVTDYQFSASQGTYSYLTGSASSLDFNTSPFIKPVPIGFTFNFSGVDYANVYACENGWISFNPNANYSS